MSFNLWSEADPDISERGFHRFHVCIIHIDSSWLAAVPGWPWQSLCSPQTISFDPRTCPPTVADQKRDPGSLDPHPHFFFWRKLMLDPPYGSAPALIRERVWCSSYKIWGSWWSYEWQSLLVCYHKCLLSLEREALNIRTIWCRCFLLQLCHLLLSRVSWSRCYKNQLCTGIIFIA